MTTHIAGEKVTFTIYADNGTDSFECLPATIVRVNGRNSVDVLVLAGDDPAYGADATYCDVPFSQVSL